MRLSLGRNTPLRPLADRARLLAERCDEFWVATAFASHDAVADVVETALNGDAKVRFLTGTFGNTTRLRTFSQLHKLVSSTSLSARIWHGDFHAKLYLWREGRAGVCWIGSSNLTNRGLENEGELVAELKGAWDGREFRALRAAFDVEWRRASALDEKFLASYQESPRGGRLLKGKSRAPTPPRRKKRRTQRGVMGVAPITGPVEEEEARLIEEKLGLAAQHYCILYTASFARARAGDCLLLVDTHTREVDIGVVTDTASHGRETVLAYDRLAKKAPTKLDARLKARLKALGLVPTTRAFRIKWLDAGRAAEAVEIVFGPRIRRRFERERTGGA